MIRWRSLHDPPHHRGGFMSRCDPGNCVVGRNSSLPGLPRQIGSKVRGQMKSSCPVGPMNQDRLTLPGAGKSGPFEDFRI